MLLLRNLLTCLAAASTVMATPIRFVEARADNTTLSGTNPISQPKTEFLGYQTASNSASLRDLGFTGSIQGKWYAVYGDTLWCAKGVTDPFKNPPGFFGMVRDSVSAMTDDPLEVHDLQLNHHQRQNQFVPFNEAWGETNRYGFGGTSLCETDYDAAQAALFYLVNADTDGLKGAGVAKVEVINKQPTVTKRFGDNGYWWPSDTNARYGDILAFRDPHSEYIYAWGGAPTQITDWVQSQYIYQVRVKAADAFDLSKYEYWWGQQEGWSTKRLDVFNAETAVAWGTGQGQIVWNQHYQCYILVHMSMGGTSVFLRTALSPEGPWTPDVKIYDATPIDGGLTYAGVAHPYLDESGKTLTISFTNNNHIEVIKATFEE